MRARRPDDAAHAVRMRTDGCGIEVAVDPKAGAKQPTLPTTGVSTRPWSGSGWSSGPRYDDPRRRRRTRHRPDHVRLHRRLRRPQPDDQRGLPAHRGTLRPDRSALARRAGTRTPTPARSSATRSPATTTTTPCWSRPPPRAAASTSVGKRRGRAQVTGWTQVFPGQLLCQSGYTSAGEIGGPVCNLRVDFHYADIEDLVEATQLDGNESARGGDSGGPVYSVNANGTVLAAGTTTRSAGPGFGFQDFATARDDYGDIRPATTLAGTCRVSYVMAYQLLEHRLQRQRHRLYNDGPAVNGWSLGWTFPGGRLTRATGTASSSRPARWSRWVTRPTTPASRPTGRSASASPPAGPPSSRRPSSSTAPPATDLFLAVPQQAGTAPPGHPARSR